MRIQKLNREVQPLVASVVEAARGDIDHPTIAAPADWQGGSWRDQSTQAEFDTPGSRKLKAANADPAQADNRPLAEQGVKPEIVAAVRISTLIRQGEDWLRLDLPKGGNVRGIVPMLMDKAGIAVMKNTRAATDEEILGRIVLQGRRRRRRAEHGPSSMKEFRPRNGDRPGAGRLAGGPSTSDLRGDHHGGRGGKGGSTHHASDAVSHVDDVEVEKQADLQAAESHIREQFCFMDRRDLDDDDSSNDQIDPIPDFDSHALIDHRQRNLRLDIQALVP